MAEDNAKAFLSASREHIHADGSRKNRNHNSLGKQTNDMNWIFLKQVSIAAKQNETIT